MAACIEPHRFLDNAFVEIARLMAGTAEALRPHVFA